MMTTRIYYDDCYCSRFPIAVGNGLDIPASESQFASSDSGSDSCDNYSSEHNLSEIVEDYTSVTEETCYTEYFKLPKHFEKVLIDQQEVLVQLVIKSVENVIIVQAKLENMLNPVGYFSGAKVKKAMDALDKPEIKTTKLKRINGLSEFRYVSSIVVTKLNKWLPSDKDYQHNDIFFSKYCYNLFIIVFQLLLEFVGLMVIVVLKECFLPPGYSQSKPLPLLPFKRREGLSYTHF